jgi:hypothetical protein
MQFMHMIMNTTASGTSMITFSTSTIGIAIEIACIFTLLKVCNWIKKRIWGRVC